MSFTPHLRVALLFASAGAAFALGAVFIASGGSGGRRGQARLLGVLCLGICVWSLSSGMVAAIDGPKGKYLLMPMSAIFQQIVAFLVLLLSRSLWRSERRAIAWPTAALAAPLALLVPALASNALHRLLWEGYPSVSAGSGGILPIRGPLFFLVPLSSIAYAIASAALILATAFRSRGRDRFRLFVIAAALCAAFLLSLASPAGPLPAFGADASPAAFLALAAICAWFFRPEGNRLPMARDWVIDKMADPYLVMDSRGHILDANKAARGLLGIGESAMGKRPSLAEPWRSALSARAQDAAPRVVAMDGPPGRAGEKRWYELIRQSVDAGRVGARVVLIHDVTDIASKGLRLRDTIAKLDRRYGRAKASENRMRELAIRDGLTSLFNRRYLEDLLPEIVSDAVLASRSLSLAMLDMDHFKAVNDRYGHDAGDAVLKGFADFLSGAIRSTDVAARYGGEEFVIVFPQLGGESARRKVESLLAAFRGKPFRAGNTSFSMTFSAGIAELLPGRDSPESLLKRADEALYRAKGSGRNRAVLAGQA